MEQILVYGAGGHARVLLEALSHVPVRVLGLVDADPAKKGLRVLGHEVLGGEEALAGLDPSALRLVNAVGSVRDLSVRRAVFHRFRAAGWKFFGPVHPSAVVARDVSLGEGAQVLSGAVVVTGSVIGANTIVNTRASVDHDCRIGDHVHLCPGVTLSGGVSVGQGSHVGAGATVIQGVRIGAGCLVAAGAVVVRDVPDGAEVFGVPARTRD
jgi:UDP-perosamine 4-acetyltransferase